MFNPKLKHRMNQRVTSTLLNLNTYATNQGFWSLTWHHSQSHLGFLFVGLAGHLHMAPVRPRVCLPERPDGQGREALSPIPPHLVPPVHFDDHILVHLGQLIDATSVGSHIATPPQMKRTGELDVVGAAQRDLRPHRGSEPLCRSSA